VLEINCHCLLAFYVAFSDSKASKIQNTERYQVLCKFQQNQTDLLPSNLSLTGSFSWLEMHWENSALPTSVSRNVQAGSWQRGCLQPTRRIKPWHFGVVIVTGNYFHQCLFSNLKWSDRICHKLTSVASQTMLFNSINLSYMVKIDIKTLESNCNWKNYLADSRFVPPIDRLTFTPIGGAFFRIQDGSKPMSREILCYLVPRSWKKHLWERECGSLTRMCQQNDISRDVTSLKRWIHSNKAVH
jgi:hypothetical protein